MSLLHLTNFYINHQSNTALPAAFHFFLALHNAIPAAIKRRKRTPLAIAAYAHTGKALSPAL